MFFINIYNKLTDKTWEETFYDYEIFRKRVIKLRYSKKLVITSRSLLEEETYRY
jgi:hypothetical protein